MKYKYNINFQLINKTMKFNFLFLERYQNENLNKILRANSSNLDDIIDERNNCISNIYPYQNETNFFYAYQNVFKQSFSQTVAKNEESDSEEIDRKIYFIEKKDLKKDNNLLEKKRKGSNLPEFEIPNKKFKMWNTINIDAQNESFLPPKTIINKNNNEKKVEENNRSTINEKEKLVDIIMEKNESNDKINKEGNQELIYEIETQIFDAFIQAYDQYKKKSDFIDDYMKVLTEKKIKDFIKLFLPGISFTKIYNEKEGNKLAIDLLENTSIKYIGNILSNQVTSKIETDKKMILKLFKIIDSFKLKEEKENKKQEKKLKNKKRKNEEFDLINKNNNQDIEEPLDELKPISCNIQQNNKKVLFNISNSVKEPSTAYKTNETNNQTFEEIQKANRSDNLFNIVKTKIIYSFVDDFNEKNANYKLPKMFNLKKQDKMTKIDIKINKQINLDFLNDNFEKYVEESKNLIKNKNNEKENLTESDEAIELVKKRKIDFLKEKLKEKGKSLFDDEKEQIKKYQNSKCKNVADKFYQTKNFQGLLSLINLAIIDDRLYLRIKDAKEFEKVIKKLAGYDNFSLELTEKEKRGIEERIKKLVKIAEDPKGYLDNIVARPNANK
jgi:hypothetical protein